MKRISKKGFVLVVLMAMFLFGLVDVNAETVIKEINVTFDDIYVGDTPFTSVSVTSDPAGAVSDSIKVKWYENNSGDVCFKFHDEENRVPMTSSKFEEGKIYSFEFDEEYINDGYVTDADTVIKFNGSEASNYCIVPESDEALPSPMNITIVNNMSVDDLSFSFSLGLFILEGSDELTVNSNEETQVSEVYNKNNKLLFTVENDKIKLADGVTSNDDIHFEHIHRNGETSVINLHFDPEGSLPIYEVIEGANSTFNPNKDESLTFRIDADFRLYGDYGSVVVDEELLFDGEYSISSGSTVVTLSKEYLSELDEGEHSLIVYFSDGGKATTKFKISNSSNETTPTNVNKTTNNPKTGDNIFIYFIVGIVSIFGFVITFLVRKKMSH